jgi:hypothetical protein
LAEHGIDVGVEGGAQHGVSAGNHEVKVEVALFADGLLEEGQDEVKSGLFLEFVFLQVQEGEVADGAAAGRVPGFARVAHGVYLFVKGEDAEEVARLHAAAAAALDEVGHGEGDAFRDGGGEGGGFDRSDGQPAYGHQEPNACLPDVMRNDHGCLFGGCTRPPYNQAAGNAIIVCEGGWGGGGGLVEGRA